MAIPCFKRIEKVLEQHARQYPDSIEYSINGKEILFLGNPLISNHISQFTKLIEVENGKIIISVRLSGRWIGSTESISLARREMTTHERTPIKLIESKNSNACELGDIGARMVIDCPTNERDLLIKLFKTLEEFEEYLNDTYEPLIYEFNELGLRKENV